MWQSLISNPRAWLALVLGMAASSVVARAQDIEPSEQQEPGDASTADETDLPAVDGEVDRGGEADPEEARLEQARALFRQGVGELEARRFGVAVRHFRQALELHDTASIRLNLAVALHGAGHSVEAHRVLDGMEGEISDAVREQATHLRNDIHSAVGRVRVTSSESAGVQLDEILLDGDAIVVGSEYAVAPGAHIIEGYRHGTVVVRREVETHASERLAVDLAVVGIEGTTPEASEPLSAGTRNIIIGTAAGVVAIALIIVLVALSVGGGSEPVQGDWGNINL